MNSRKLISALILVCYLKVNSYGAIGPNCEDFFQELDSAHNKHDAVALIRLAAATVGKDCWSMGGAQGPTDAASLRLRAFWSAGEWIFDGNGALRGDVRDAIANPTDAENQIIDWLTVLPTDTQKMLSLLMNDDPAARWVGIYKTRFVAPSPTPIIQALTNIVANDNDIVLTNIPIPRTDATPVPSPGVTREFVAPLRRFASEQLAKWNQNVSVDETDVARAGVENLLDEYSSNSAHKDTIVWAISRLTMGHSPVAEQALRTFVPDTADRQHAFGEFKKAAKLQ
jgi:hypothetical protein